jgi:pyridoxal phosphate enzyme (YggS family)
MHEPPKPSVGPALGVELTALRLAQLRAGLEQTLERISAACLRVGRERGSVQLLLATKTQPVQVIDAAAEMLRTQGVRVVLGENYVQEFVKKRDVLQPPIESHLIGSLQRNKAALAVRTFDVIQSVDSLKLALALQRAAQEALRRLPVYLQVNISDDQAKHGFSAQQLVVELPQLLQQCPQLELRGLMAITRLYENPQHARADFIAVRLLAEQLSASCGLGTLELSMGMSSDFEIAIEEGATMVRIGSLIFGARE